MPLSLYPYNDGVRHTHTHTYTYEKGPYLHGILGTSIPLNNERTIYLSIYLTQQISTRKINLELIR